MKDTCSCASTEDDAIDVALGCDNEHLLMFANNIMVSTERNATMFLEK